jgi:3-isopropylmalate/(R)-2-methylmalate dehydratase small subunit
MMETLIRGKAWVGGNNIVAFQIIPLRRWDPDNLDPDELGKWALEDADPDFRNKEFALKNGGYSIVAAGTNFGGGGKSIEHPIIALKSAGIKIVLAESFSRFNFRNSVNNGLPAFVCKGITEMVKKGDELTVDLVAGFVKNERTGVSLKIAAMPQFAIDLINAGGLIPYTRAKISAKKKLEEPKGKG